MPLNQSTSSSGPASWAKVTSLGREYGNNIENEDDRGGE